MDYHPSGSDTCSSRLEEEFVLTISVSLILSSTLSVIGNIFTLITMFRSPIFLSATNFFLASIALCDFFSGIFLGPLWVVQLHNRDLLDKRDALIVAFQFLTLQIMLVNTYTLCALTYERFLALTRFIYYDKIMNKKRTTAIVLSIWILSTILASSRYIILWIKNSLGFLVGEAVFIIFVPLLAFSLFTKRFSSASKTSQIVPKDVEDNPAMKARAVKEMKNVRYVAIIVSIFLISWTPFFVLCGVDAILNSIKPCAAIEIRFKLKTLAMFLTIV